MPSSVYTLNMAAVFLIRRDAMTILVYYNISMIDTTIFVYPYCIKGIHCPSHVTYIIQVKAIFMVLEVLQITIYIIWVFTNSKKRFLYNQVAKTN